MTKTTSEEIIPHPNIYIGMPDDFWPPRVLWGREQGWLNVRDPWGQWHSIPAKQAPSGYARIATKAKRGEA